MVDNNPESKIRMQRRVHIIGCSVAIRLLAVFFLALTTSPGMAAYHTLGTDQNGVPIFCGSAVAGAQPTSQLSPQGKKQPPPPPPPILPDGMRMWEVVPGVIRDNGTDACRVVVNCNGPVSNVTMIVWQRYVTESGMTNVILHDDGLNGDSVAGDYIYTSELIRYNTNYSSPIWPNYRYDTNSPANIMTDYLCTLSVVETNGTNYTFLEGPQVGLMSQSIPLVHTVQLSSNVVVSPHLINVLGTNLATQKLLREYSLETGELPGKIYSVLPDAFDFLVYFSTYKVEYAADVGNNAIAGIHQNLQVNFSGTGQGQFNNSTAYGSAGRLLGVSVLDSYSRGMSSGICTHELLHQWGSYMPFFSFSDGSHYTRYSNVGSLLGGFRWTNNPDGQWVKDCSEGSYGATHLDALDKYLMGLIATNLVSPIYVVSSTPTVYCGAVVSNVMDTITIQDIVNQYGLRTPGPATAQKDFSIGFVAESYERLLTPVEMTFYEAFAAQYTKPVPAGWADPYIGSNWAPITRFFGEGTTWSSEVLSLIQPVIESLQLSPDGHCEIVGKGLANHTYRVETSADLQTWLTVTNQTTGTNGIFNCSILSDNSANAGFYRITWP